MELIAHPDWPPTGVTGIRVIGEVRGGLSVLDYRVAGAMPVVPAPADPVRTNGLWQRTCFELFVKPAGGAGYFEFNFSPSGAWAAYRFEGYRAGMAELPLAPPVIERLDDGVRVTVDLRGLPGGTWDVAITAVIEEEGGARSFWALRHPGGKPDFHDITGFALNVSAD